MTSHIEFEEAVQSLLAQVNDVDLAELLRDPEEDEEETVGSAAPRGSAVCRALLPDSRQN
jgi:hypothetical protein